jgi:hypothetical protein
MPWLKSGIKRIRQLPRLQHLLLLLTTNPIIHIPRPVSCPLRTAQSHHQQPADSVKSQRGAVFFHHRTARILLSTVPANLSHSKARRGKAEAVNTPQHLVRGRGEGVHFKEPHPAIPLVETDVVVVDLEAQAAGGVRLVVFVHGRCIWGR